MRSRNAVLAALLALCMAPAGDARPRASAAGLTDEMRALYAEMFRESVPMRTAASLQEEARREIFSADLDGGGLSRRDIELAREMADASARADRIRHYFGSDLNRDGVLTLDEFRTALRKVDVESYYRQYETALRQHEPLPTAVTQSVAADAGFQIQRFAEMDADHDGRLSFREVYDYDEPVVYAPAQRFVDAEKYLVLDSNGDGNVTLEEVNATSAAFFAEQALAGVGPRPQSAAGEEDDGPRRLEDSVQCPVPAPSAAARIVRLGTREGGQLASVALGGQDVPT